MKPEVLVVDDSMTVRMDVGDALSDAGFEVVFAADLKSARAALATHHVRLIVLDVLLPDGSGMDFLKELRSAEATASLPVMLLSTEAEVRSRLKGFHSGADEYIGKPYDRTQLVARARAFVQPAATGPHVARVLVVDDSLTFREEMRRALSHAGFEVLEAETGEDALSRIAVARPDAVIVDGMLPGIDGATVVRRLKSDSSLRGTPCLLLTAAEEKQHELSALEAGADAYLRKSEGVDVILARLSALLRHAVRFSRTESPSLLGPKRLLAVDDSATYLDVLGRELGREGYDVVLAASGEEAIEMLGAQVVDCILLDRVMPGMSGEETCRRIKQSAAWRDIPLVMLTASDDREAMIAGINAGADDYIAKSADFEVLKARLRAQLRRKHFEDENRRIREELVRREIEARFQKLVHSNIIGIVLSDFSGNLLDANDAFLDLVAHTRVELGSGQLRWEELATADTRLLHSSMIERLRQTGSCAPFEAELVRRDGRIVPVLYGLVRLEGTDTAVGFVVDRTAQRDAEEKLKNYAATLEGKNLELELANARAERQSRYKSQFLAGMSHELRTPLNAIIGFSELLEQELFGPLAPRQLEYVKHVLSSGRHLLSLVNDVLDLSKVEAGRMELAREWTWLSTVLDVALETAAPLAQKRGVSLESSVPGDLPKLYLDPVRIKQVLYNLVSNAIKFTPEGGSVRLTAEVSGKDLKISCIDSGVGIRPEDLPRLFREFEQIGPPSGARTEGTGLGLALTKRFIELHGGSIAVESAPGQGSTFTFTLPMLRGEVGAPPFQTPRPSPLEPTVLVVEDDAQATELIAGHLRAAGLAVVTASRAEDALRLAEELKPKAITLDIVMAGLDGWAILPRLRSSAATRSVPIVIVSVIDEPNRGLVLGATDYLVKPVSRDALLESLEMAGVPVHRVSGLRVLIAGKSKAELEQAEAHLKQAGCLVRRLEELSAGALTGEAEIDVAIVDLADAVANAPALAHAAEDLPFPVIGIADHDETRSPSLEGLVPLARSDVRAPDRLVRCVRRVVDARRAAPAAGKRRGREGGA